MERERRRRRRKGEVEGLSGRGGGGGQLLYRNRQLEWELWYLSSQLRVAGKCEAGVSRFSGEAAGEAAAAIRTTAVSTSHKAMGGEQRRSSAHFTL